MSDVRYSNAKADIVVRFASIWPRVSVIFGLLSTAKRPPTEATLLVVVVIRLTNRSRHEPVARHQGRVPAFNGDSAQLAVKAFDPTPQSDVLRSIIDPPHFPNRHVSIIANDQK